MAEELTTAMHEEFVGDEIKHLDLQVMGVYGAIRRGVEKRKALADYGISESEYAENIDRVLNT